MYDGLLNKLGSIYKNVNTASTVNGEKVKSRSLKHSNVPCTVQPLSGTELVASHKVYETATHKIFVSNMFDIKISDTIFVENVYYNLLLKKDAAGRGHHFEFIAEVSG